jgi:iron complex outermembrane receptor protein
LRVHSEPQFGAPDRATRDSIVRDPNRQLTLRSLLDLGAHWELDAALRYVSAIAMSSVPGYAEADLRLGWRPLPAWEFSLLGQNLLHARHAEFNPPGSRRELPRSVFAKASWSF